MSKTVALIGEHVAPDGWRLAWNLERKPATIAVYGADGVRRYAISGEIAPSRLERELRKFRRAHPRQGRLW